MEETGKWTDAREETIIMEQVDGKRWHRETKRERW